MKSKYIFPAILLPIFLIGIILTVIGVAMGGTLFSYSVDSDPGEGYQNGIVSLSAGEAADLHSIDWKLSTSQVKVISGDHFEISGDGVYQSYVKDGTWYIKTKKRTARLFFLTHSIEIPYFWNWHWNNDSASNTIMIPRDTAFQSADIRISAGELIGETLEADNLTLKVGAGEGEWQQIKAKHLTVDVGAGSSTINQLTVTDNCEAKCGAGELVLGKDDYTRVNSIANLQGECAAGELDVCGKLTENNNLKCAMGEIDLTLAGTKTNYSISQNASMGEINIHDNDISNQSGNNTETFGNLSLKCSMGEIVVDFEH